MKKRITNSVVDTEQQMLQRSLFQEGDIKEQEGNCHQCKGDYSFHIGIEDINLFVHSEFLSRNAAAKQNVALSRSIVNTASLFPPFNPRKLGTIITAASQPADRLINKSDKTDIQTGFTVSTVSAGNCYVNWGKRIR